MKTLTRQPKVKTDKRPSKKISAASGGKNPAKFAVMNGFIGRGGHC